MNCSPSKQIAYLDVIASKIVRTIKKMEAGLGPFLREDAIRLMVEESVGRGEIRAVEASQLTDIVRRMR